MKTFNARKPRFNFYFFWFFVVNDVIGIGATIALLVVGDWWLAICQTALCCVCLWATRTCRATHRTDLIHYQVAAALVARFGHSQHPRLLRYGADSLQLDQGSDGMLRLYRSREPSLEAAYFPEEDGLIIPGDYFQVIVSKRVARIYYVPAACLIDRDWERGRTITSSRFTLHSDTLKLAEADRLRALLPQLEGAIEIPGRWSRNEAGAWTWSDANPS